MKLLIGIPSFDMVHADFMMSFADLIEALHVWKPGIDIIRLNQRYPYIQISRNKIAQAAIDVGADFCLMLDSDMQFHPRAVIRLIEADRDIAGALYVAKRPPFPMVGLPEEMPPKPDERGFIKMEHIGGGIMLIKTDVLRIMASGIDDLWFDCPRDDGAADRILGEDIHFCERASLSCDIWGDTQSLNDVAHIGMLPFDTGLVDRLVRK